ncbi:hypothetical protein [Myroides sp. WP-1]|uniref:hypothetical protein n=1 Tax=Myroides sp. WP-1 TaxID=2759944 RepID=UPI0015FE4052|nr:hypothetical protein [Myroides sp. WP-1]MBB1140353.1 hypothetical protein [Myroides sp. WP-1]
MSPKPQPHMLSKNDSHNLALLQELYDLNPDFASYAQSINALFYYYVQHCTENADEFFLNASDVHQVLEIVHTQQKLKKPKN